MTALTNIHLMNLIIEAQGLNIQSTTIYMPKTKKRLATYFRAHHVMHNTNLPGLWVMGVSTSIQTMFCHSRAPVNLKTIYHNLLGNHGMKKNETIVCPHLR